MIEIKKAQRADIAPLFKGIEDSMVTAYLQGYMGQGYVMTLRHPKAALIVSGEYSFWGGDPDATDAAYLIAHFFQVLSNHSSVGIFAEDMPRWENALLACKANNPVAVDRYGIVQRDYDFDKVVLQRFVNDLNPKYELIPFDADCYKQAMQEAWSAEFCETFTSEEDYLARGFGFGVMCEGKLVSGASTMTVYDGGTEIQVATHPQYRRQGLALPCAAKLILACMERNMRPCWDAANEVSLKMALKLGYAYKGVYTTIHMHK